MDRSRRAEPPAPRPSHKAAYVAPRLEMVALRPEERLLVCNKASPLDSPCDTDGVALS